MTQLDHIARLLSERGSERYGGEAISQLDHALQCATLAEHAGATDALVTAALLHDIGHLLADDEGAAGRGVDMRHEIRGAEYLEPIFGDAVTAPIRLHVLAKRYLCAISPRYVKRLSQESIKSLDVQGGPYRMRDADAFVTNAHSGASIRLRVWDDLAKSPDARTPSLAHFMARAERALGGPGRLVLMVGHSGAGKDTLIAAAREQFSGVPNVIFPRRVITRPCEAGQEFHHSVTQPEFHALRGHGAFCLHWQAQGLWYGVPSTALRHIAAGRTVVVKVSHSVAEHAMSHFRNVDIIDVMAPRDDLLTRLTTRRGVLSA